MSQNAGFLAEMATLLGSGAVFALVARQSLSFRKWSSQTSLFRGLETLTEPWLVPVRRHLPRLRGIDLSPWVAAAMAAGLTIVLRVLLSRGST
ncbi:MAG: YggT family protein [Fibrobacterota bacterium]